MATLRGLPLNAWYARLSQSLLRHRPDQDQPPHPPSFNIVMHPPRLSYGPFKLFSPRKGTYTTFNLKASLKDLYGGLSGTDCFLPATSTPAIAPARNQPCPPRKPSEIGLMPLGAPSGWTRNTWGFVPRAGHVCSRLVVSNLLPP